VTIVTGFLGSGKTSLINHIACSEMGRRLALLVNDFGAVNIDAGLIEKGAGEIVTLENGCICCSLSDGLLAGVIRLIGLPEPPERIVIETSGVSDPLEVAHTFADPELQIHAPLDGIVTLVDAETAPTLDGEIRELARRQVEAADIVLLNKIDIVDAEGLRRARAWLRAISPSARVHETFGGRAPLELIFGGAGAAAGAPGRYASAPASDLFESFVFESATPLALADVQDTLAALPVSIYRVKGLLNLREKPEHRCWLQATGRRAALTVGDAWGDTPSKSQIVFIGARGGVDGRQLTKWLTGR